jgi:hypothetical protein
MRSAEPLTFFALPQPKAETEPCRLATGQAAVIVVAERT